MRSFAFFTALSSVLALSANAIPQAASSASAAATSAAPSAVSGASRSSSAGSTSSSAGADATSTTAAAAATSSVSATACPVTGESGQPAIIESSGPAVNGSLSFGENYAVLFLDYVSGIVGGVRGTPAGDAFINSSRTWYDAVHQLSPQPPTLYSRLYFENDQYYEIEDVPWGFAQVRGTTNFTSAANASQIIEEVAPKGNDFVFKKIRYNAAFANDAILTLRSQRIDTVVLSGIRTSGVIQSTAYALFDNNFNVFIISNNTIEPPPNDQLIQQAVLGPNGTIGKLPANIITVEQAMQAIGGANNSSSSS